MITLISSLTLSSLAILLGYRTIRSSMGSSTAFPASASLRFLVLEGVIKLA